MNILKKLGFTPNKAITTNNVRNAKAVRNFLSPPVVHNLNANTYIKPPYKLNPPLKTNKTRRAEYYRRVAINKVIPGFQFPLDTLS